jgi:hypothetical protein
VSSLLLFAAAACSTEPTATPTPSPTAPATATATPQATATATPTELTGPTATATPVPGATAVSITPSADATLYDVGSQLAANGAGHSLFFGSTNGNEPRRTLVRCDLTSELPSGATIASARLVMVVTRSRAEPDEATLHRVTSSWGEGTADSETAGEGSGTEPDAGNATWVHREYPDVMWGSPGGDFDVEPLATTLVLPPPRAGTVEVSWGATEAMIADVQRWLDEPSSNFGWLILGDDATRQTTKRVASRENEDEGLRPRLLIEYFPPGA